MTAQFWIFYLSVVCGLFVTYYISNKIADGIIARRWKRAVDSELAYIRDEQRKILEAAARLP